MKKNILKSLLVSVLCMLAASCQDTEFAEAVDSSKAQVMFSIAMDSPAARSRATWGENQSSQSPVIGDEYDNRINMKEFIVKLEGKVNGVNQEYSIKEIIKWKEDGADENNYKFVGIVDGINGETTIKDAKITVYANMGETYSDEIETKTFTRESAKDYIPMWGVLSPGDLIFRPGKRTPVDDIYLLRAMAKFQVTLGDAAIEKGYTLTKASLNKFNPTGNYMPNGYTDATSTMALGLEAVMNENTTNQAGATELTEATEDGKGWVIYLPEISNTTDSELKMLLTFSKEDNEQIETEVSVKDYSTENTGLVNIVRNHWYKYVIEDIVNAKPVVNYETLDWGEPINIEVGGEGFLGLSTDLVEVFSANTGTLKFHSSTPIKSVKLKDIYKHEHNGTFTEGTTDDFKAYYLTKFGQKVELGQYPGFEIVDQETALAKETQILAYIDENASWDANVNEGTITINSPYIGHTDYGDSHNDTPRYLEFEVINGQDLTATFRMVQYPPVVITNVEGYFSYREDMRIGNLPYKYDKSQFTSPYTIVPVDNGEANHFLNPVPPFFTIANFFPYHEHEWDPVKNRVITAVKHGGCPGVKDYEGYDETLSGIYQRDHMRFDEYKGSPISGVVHRTHYICSDGSAFVGANIGKPQNYYQNLGPVYEKEIEENIIDETTGEIIGKKKVTKSYRRHYTGTAFGFFHSKFVDRFNEDGTASINSQYPGGDLNSWVVWANWYTNGNHRMYHIKTTTTLFDYTIGWPKLETIDDRTYTAEGVANSKMISPSFMVASQLGTTAVPYDRDGYIVPKEGGMYPLAKRQCEQYVEATYVDEDNSGKYEAGEPVIHYNDWRLPTKAEVEMIIQYQQNSRAMDKVLDGQFYFSASLDPNDYNASTVLTANMDKEWTKEKYHIRCVRDVKSKNDGIIKFYER